MFFRSFFLLFLILAVLEIYVLIEVGNWLGAPATIGLILLTGIIGVGLLKHQGLSVFERFKGKMQQGQAPAQEIIEGVLLIIAGAFLITPGFVTDTIGFLWLIPATRSAFAKGMIKAGWFKFQKMNGQGNFYYQYNQQSETRTRTEQEERHEEQTKVSGSRIIEGEYERKDDEKH
ncbi:FxsA family protein [Kangiella aquimarina]|uniref:FxsA family protein n=1 Tax=Kangiella aquimarina TaxID=261965 RepID=A0ABZ0X4I2_9GAMM|nr:FxsA family protein [Kangiella aquimarina]WQG85420.1 FxsA family protein [Kangiella aquimarina]